jgi:hypothetical protein
MHVLDIFENARGLSCKRLFLDLKWRNQNTAVHEVASETICEELK